MKHLFFIHSHITWLVSGGVIRQRGLRRDEVLFVCARDYRPPDAAYELLDFPDRRFLPTWRIGQWLRQRRELAQFVDGVARDGDFLWYLPHTGFPFFAAFVGHPRCRGFHLIEEGMGSYCTPEGLVDSMRRFLECKPGWKGLVLRLWTKMRPPKMADERYLMAYGCTDEAFPGYERKTKVDLVGPSLTGTQDMEAVLVFDNVLEASLVGEEAYFRCVEELVTTLAQEGRRTVHYKLHPGQYIDRRYMPRLRQLLQGNPHGLDFIELPPDCCLELLAARGGPDFYVFVSSVGFYAAVGGCRVFSMAARLAALDARYRVILDMVPDLMRRRLVFL